MTKQCATTGLSRSSHLILSWLWILFLNISSFLQETRESKPKTERKNKCWKGSLASFYGFNSGFNSGFKFFSVDIFLFVYVQATGFRSAGIINSNKERVASRKRNEHVFNCFLSLVCWIVGLLCNFLNALVLSFVRTADNTIIIMPPLRCAASHAVQHSECTSWQRWNKIEIHSTWRNQRRAY